MLEMVIREETAAAARSLTKRDSGVVRFPSLLPLLELEGTLKLWRDLITFALRLLQGFF